MHWLAGIVKHPAVLLLMANGNVLMQRSQIPRFECRSVVKAQIPWSSGSNTPFGHAPRTFMGAQCVPTPGTLALGWHLERRSTHWTWNRQGIYAASTNPTHAQPCTIRPRVCMARPLVASPDTHGPTADATASTSRSFVGTTSRARGHLPPPRPEKTHDRDRT